MGPFPPNGNGPYFSIEGAKSCVRRSERPAFAHRGLHGAGVRENSLEAFERACEAGYGIEMDLRLSRDGAVVVCHDEDLGRLWGRPERVDALTSEELRGLGIATLDEVLDCVRGRVPLLLELKRGRGWRRLTGQVAAMLARYAGEVWLESFDPRVVARLRRLCPARRRGQLLCARSYLARRLLRLAAAVCRLVGRPDFLAVELPVRDTVLRGAGKGRGLSALVWTVTDPDTYADCLRRGETPIFEGFLPDA